MCVLPDTDLGFLVWYPYHWYTIENCWIIDYEFHLFESTNNLIMAEYKINFLKLFSFFGSYSLCRRKLKPSWLEVPEHKWGGQQGWKIRRETWKKVERLGLNISSNCTHLCPATELHRHSGIPRRQAENKASLSTKDWKNCHIKGRPASAVWVQASPCLQQQNTFNPQSQKKQQNPELLQHCVGNILFLNKN